MAQTASTAREEFTAWGSLCTYLSSTPPLTATSSCSSNVIVNQPLFKTDFAGHSKTFTNNVALYGACGGSQVGSNDGTNVFSNNKCVGGGSPLAAKTGGCVVCTPGQPLTHGHVAGTKTCPHISDNTYYKANANTTSPICKAPLAGKLEQVKQISRDIISAVNYSSKSLLLTAPRSRARRWSRCRRTAASRSPRPRWA